MSGRFWSGRPVLITGHTGFKGSWLSLWLHHLGAELTGYALTAPTVPSLFEQARVAEAMVSETADVCDGARLQRVMRAQAPEVVLHLAAQALVRAGYDDPWQTYATNVMGTVSVLEAVRRTPSVRAVVIVTTDKCYAEEESSRGYRETDRLGGRDPYSSSKACAELVTDAYRSSFFHPGRHAEHRVAVASARAGNVIGGGDWARDRLVPDAMRAFLEGKKVVLRNPDAVRPWQHVLDPLAGYLLLAERLVTDGPAVGEAWNFGPPDEFVLPVQALTTRLATLWGEGAGLVCDIDADGPHEARQLRLDASKARARLAWRSLLPVEDALAWTVEWYRGVGRGAPARELTLHQIVRYMDRWEPAANVRTPP